MSDKKQTAVEWLVKEINKLTGLNIAIDEPCIKQAKEMEKQQIISAFVHGEIFGSDYFDPNKPNEECSKNYYNQTFKNTENETI